MNACEVYFVCLPLNYNRSLDVTEEMQAVHQLSVVDIDNQTISNATGEWVAQTSFKIGFIIWRI